MFHPLDSQTLAAITQQLLSQTGERLSALGIASRWSRRRCGSWPRPGPARTTAPAPLRRAIAAQVEDPAADLMLENCLKKGDTLQVWAEKGQIQVKLAGSSNLRQS